MLRTLRREHGVKFANAEQKDFYRDFKVRFPGSPDMMRKRVRELSRQYNGFACDRRVMCRRISHEEAVDRWGDLEDEVQENWTRRAREENRRIRKQKEDLDRLVSADTATVPFGSVDKTCPIIASELPDLPHNDDGFLENLPREDSIEEWGKTSDVFAKQHIPAKRDSDNLRDTILPGERRSKCKSLRQTWLVVLLPLREALRRYYRMSNGDTEGITTCLVWGDRRFWFEATLLFEPTESILGIPINTQHADDVTADGPLGPYPSPQSYLEPGDIFPGDSFDLIDFCMGRNRGRPPYFIFVRKAVVILQSKGWWAYLSHFSQAVDRGEVNVKAYQWHHVKTRQTEIWAVKQLVGERRKSSPNAKQSRT